MSKQILSDQDFNSASRILNLPDPTLPQSPATKAYVDSAVEGLAWKDSCRVSTVAANVNLAVPGAMIDSIVMVAGDRVLVRSQTAGAENGIYIWNGAATPMTRSLDANTANELEQAVVTIEEGTDTASTWRQTILNFVLGTNTLTWASFGTGSPAASTATAGIAALATQGEVDTGVVTNKIVTPATLASWFGRVRRLGFDVGDGSATSYALNHNFNTRDVEVGVFRNSGSFDEIACDINHTSVNSVTLIFSAAPTANQFRAVIVG